MAVLKQQGLNLRDVQTGPELGFIGKYLHILLHKKHWEPKYCCLILVVEAELQLVLYI